MKEKKTSLEKTKTEEKSTSQEDKEDKEELSKTAN